MARRLHRYAKVVGRLPVVVVAVFGGVAFLFWWVTIRMPGTSFTGALTDPSPDERLLAQVLEQDVRFLNDNASGVAILLELARRFRSHRADRELRLVWFTNEEPPHFQTNNMGSLRYARSLADEKRQVAAMLSLETLGYYTDQPDSQRYPSAVAGFFPSTGNFVAFVGDNNSAGLVRQAIETFRATTPFPSEGLASSARVPVNSGTVPASSSNFRARLTPAALSCTAPRPRPSSHGTRLIAPHHRPSRSGEIHVRSCIRRAPRRRLARCRFLDGQALRQGCSSC